MAGLQKWIASFSNLQPCIQKFQELHQEGVLSFPSSLDLSASLIHSAVDLISGDPYEFRNQLVAHERSWLKHERYELTYNCDIYNRPLEQESFVFLLSVLNTG